MRTLIFGLMVFAAPVVAQNANQVTLKYDDGTGVTGELSTFEDGIFQIKSSIGTVAIPASDVSCIGSACPEGTALEVPSSAVVLTSIDGASQLSGDLIEFADDEYVLATDIGEVRIRADQVTCEGEGCVALEEPVSSTVTLVNDSTEIEGEFLRIEDGAYIVYNEILGEIRVNSDTFECRGDRCP